MGITAKLSTLRSIVFLNIAIFFLLGINSKAFAQMNPYHNNSDVESAQGRITKLVVSNENNMEPGFSLCVKDLKQGEVCMWRKSNTFNYQQLLDIANLAVRTDKVVIIKSNIVGSLDTIILLLN